MIQDLDTRLLSDKLHAEIIEKADEYFTQRLQEEQYSENQWILPIRIFRNPIVQRLNHEFASEFTSLQIFRGKRKRIYRTAVEEAAIRHGYSRGQATFTGHDAALRPNGINIYPDTSPNLEMWVQRESTQTSGPVKNILF